MGRLKFNDILSRIKRLRGILLLEVIFAIALFTVVGSSVVLLVTSLLTDVTYTKDSLRAQMMAEEGLEASRIIRDMDWGDLALGTHGLSYEDGAWTFDGSADSEDGFTRSVSISEIATNERKIDVSVSWDMLNGRSITHTLSSVLSNWRNLGSLAGDWDNPYITGDLLDFGNGFRAIGIDIGENIIYLAGHGSISSAMELYLVDVSDPLNPQKLGSVSTGKGINELSVNDDRTLVFAASAGNSQLEVYFATPVDNPRLAKTYKISGNRHTGRSIDLVGDMVYLGTEGADAYEFFVIDVSTYTSPVVRSSISVGNDVNDVMVVGDYAYIVSDVDNREVGIIDISDPDHASVASFVDLPGLNDAEGIFMDPSTNRAYVGRQVATGPNTPEVVILDVSDPEHPTILASREHDADVDSMLAIGDQMFVVADTPEEFLIFDVSNLPVLTQTGALDLGENSNPTDLLFQDNYFYIAIFDRLGLRVVTAD